MSDHNPEVFILIAMFTAIGWIVWVLVNGVKTRNRIRAMTEFHNRLLDKMGSAKEFADFLQSEGGDRFLKSVTIEKVNPNQRILGAIQTGLVFAFFGLGLLLLGWEFDFDEHAFTVLGTVTLALGCGFLVSSIVSYRLSRAWGLFNGGGSNASEK